VTFATHTVNQKLKKIIRRLRESHPLPQLIIREEEENNLPQMKKLFSFTKKDLVKHIEKEQFRRVDYFFRLP